MEIMRRDENQMERDPFERFMERFFSRTPFSSWGRMLTPFSEMGDVGRGGFDEGAWQGGGQMMTWRPTCEIEEEEERYTVHAELPGVKQDDVHVRLDDGCLIIEGERQMAREEKKGGRRRTERSYGHFERSFRLPQTIERDKVKAHFEDGVLSVELPKSSKAKQERREIPLR